MSKRRPTEKQLAANRANAAQSTGPRSPEGRARSAQNARKHGFTADVFTANSVEEANEVAHLVADAVEFYQPQNSQEQFAVEAIALAQQTMIRAARLEAGMLTAALIDFVHEGDLGMFKVDFDLSADPMTPDQDRHLMVAQRFTQFHGKAGFALVLRYQALAERRYHRAVREFERLKALSGNPVSPCCPTHEGSGSALGGMPPSQGLRDELPNEPICASQPEQTEPTSAPEIEPVSALPGLPPGPERRLRTRGIPLSDPPAALQLLQRPSPPPIAFPPPAGDR